MATLRFPLSIFQSKLLMILIRKSKLNLLFPREKITSVLWPICNENTDATTLETCQSSWNYVQRENLLQNLTEYLNCSDLIFNQEMIFSNLSWTSNGSFCTLTDPILQYNASTEICQIIDHPYFNGLCDSSIGNGTLTFWLVSFINLIHAVLFDTYWQLTNL